MIPMDMVQQQNELTQLIDRFVSKDGVYETEIPSLYLIRQTHLSEPAYRVYKPSFCVISQGLKELFLAEKSFEYGETDYLIASMNLPVVGQIIKASPESPYLSLKLEFTQGQILEVLNESNLQINSKENGKRALFVGQMELTLMDAVLRLTRLLDTPKDIPFLAPLIIKEILYKLLQGPYGVTLGQIALEESSTYRISNAIETIIQNYDQPLRVEKLAEIAHMSVSTFHRNFKAVTEMSPIQFQKQLRLQEARRILLSESAGAADVAFRVGYESASQFSREYARMFGAPPRVDVKQLIEKYDPTKNMV